MPVGSPTPTCPKCGSSSLSATSKGFGSGKALAGGALLGPAGLLAGFVGSQDVRIVCLACKSRLRPAELKIVGPLPEPLPPPEPTEEERFWEAERERLSHRDRERGETDAVTRAAELQAIIAEKGFSQSDVSWFGAEELAGHILDQRKQEAQERRLADRLAADALRVESRRATLIASGYHPDAVPAVVPIRTGQEGQQGILKWPPWKARS